jgi:5-(carboxyamino)imidazole ribonucleotide mutase
VAVNAAQNAGILAAQILATADAALLERLVAFKKELGDKVIADDEALSPKRSKLGF